MTTFSEKVLHMALIKVAINSIRPIPELYYINIYSSSRGCAAALYYDTRICLVFAMAIRSFIAQSYYMPWSQ
jgi:hypothetical protein